MGHDVKLIPAQFVRPYVKSNKADAAEATCEAAQRPGMWFVAVEELDVQALHRTRRLLVKPRTQTVNSLRGHPYKEVKMTSCPSRRCHIVGHLHRGFEHSRRLSGSIKSP